MSEAVRYLDLFFTTASFRVAKEWEIVKAEIDRLRKENKELRTDLKDLKLESDLFGTY